MAKLFLISINLFVLFAIKIFFGGDVSVKQQMKDTIRPGETLDVTLEITKGDREGFAKWQQTLPDGFIASSVEMNGATFSFKNQQIKVIWMELPKTETFTINYTIETSTEVSGEHNLNGKFSFIEENERRDINAETFILSIEQGALVDNTGEMSENDEVTPPESETVAEEVVEDVVKETDETEEIIEVVKKVTAEEPKIAHNDKVITTAANNKLISVTREIEHIADGNYEVTLKIRKTDLNSFGKIEDYLPPNYTASEIESNNGIFTFNNNVMKVLWMSLPKEENFEIKYAMNSTSNELDSATIFGVLSYLNVDQSVQNKLAPSKFRNFLAEVQSEELAEVPEEEEEPSDENELMEDAVDNNEAQADIIEDTFVEEAENFETPEEQTTAENVTNIPAAETTVSYKVQIAASHKEVDQSYFIQRHNVTEAVAIEFHETWYKYTVGAYPVYKAARDKRNQVWAANNKINDAFVTAYNAGDRISVQEALMISKQKWYK